MRALNTWLFEVLSLTPSISPICLCSSPSTSWSTKATRHPSGNRATARSMSILAPWVSRVDGMYGAFVFERPRRRAHPPLAASQKVETLADGEPVQPGAERGVSPVAVELSIDLEKDVLQEVFALLRRPRHPAGEGKEPRRVLPVEQFEGIAIARPAARDQFGIRPAHP